MKTTVKEFYELLTPKQKKEFKNNVLILSGMKRNQFYYRLERDAWSELELEAINRLIDKSGFTVGRQPIERLKFIKPMKFE